MLATKGRVGMVMMVVRSAGKGAWLGWEGVKRLGATDGRELRGLLLLLGGLLLLLLLLLSLDRMETQAGSSARLKDNGEKERHDGDDVGRLR